MKHLFWTALCAVALCAPGHLLAESAPKPLALMDAEALSAEEARTTADATAALEARLEKRLRQAINEPFFNGDAFYLGSAGVVFVARVPFFLNGEAANSSGDLWEEARRDLTQGANKSAERTALLKSALVEEVQNAEWDVKSLGPLAAVAVGKGHSILTVRRSDEVSVQFHTLENSPALEDAATMARVLEKTAGADNSVHNIRGIPIEGFGILFAANAELPLAASPQNDSAQTPLDPETLEAQSRLPELSGILRDLLGENLPEDLAVRPFVLRLEEFPGMDLNFEAFNLKRGDFKQVPPELEAQLKDLVERMGSSRYDTDDALPFALPFAFPRPYDAGKAEALTTRLMEALKHGARLRLEPTETVAVAVLGAPTFETTKTHDNSEDGIQYRASVTVLSGHASTNTFMAFRVSKDSIDRFAAGELTLEALKNEARVVTGIE